MKKIFTLLSIQFLSILCYSQFPASLDQTFNTFGMSVLPANMSFLPQVNPKMVIQPDGKYVVAGSINNGMFEDFLISRILPNGSFDLGFANSGIFQSSIMPYFNQCVGIDIQPDGKIVAAGIYNNSLNNEIFLVRLQSNGTLDTTFGTNGMATISLFANDEKVTDMKLLSSGKIALCGFVQSDSAFVIRCNANGSLDNSFANNGSYVFRHNGENTDIYALDELANNALLVAGSNYTSANYQDVFALKLTSNGLPDNTFGNNGVFMLNISGDYDEIHDIKILPSGEILLAGYSYNGNNDGALVVKLTPNGAVVPSFGTNGYFNYCFSNTPSRTFSLDVQQNGKIVLGGEYADVVTGMYDYYLMRLNANGSMDSTFNNNSPFVTSDFNLENDGITSLKIQPDGKIMAYGKAVMNSTTQEESPALARYAGDPVVITGIEARVHEEISIYPNPANHLIYLKMLSADGIRYQVVNQAGQVVLSSSLNTDRSIDIQSLPKGIYVLSCFRKDDLISSISFGKK
jgi:uncharacterized delta-60 repeat protein